MTTPTTTTTDPARARRRIAQLLEENALAQDRARRMQTVQLEELFRRQQERKLLLGVLKAAGGDPTPFELRDENLA